MNINVNKIAEYLFMQQFNEVNNQLATWNLIAAVSNLKSEGLHKIC